MFTGIVECLGIVKSFDKMDLSNSGGNGISLVIKDADIVLSDCNLGDSIACNGICLTVTEFNEARTEFKVGIAPETIRKTNLSNRGVDVDQLKEGMAVNLERAMNGTSRFGGHFVQGHVDCPVHIVSIRKDPPNSLIFRFQVPEPGPDGSDFLTYIVPKGYVCLDGTSLTVIDVDWKARQFSVMLIAYTQSKVVMTSKDEGDLVDQMGKYVENTVRAMMNAGTGPIQAMIENTVRKIMEEK